MWLNLLSLDAPLVAVAWQLLFAKSARVDVRPGTTVAFSLVVWLIYDADRILDSLRSQDAMTLAARHRFYRKHRPVFLPLFFGVLALADWVSLTRVDPKTLRDGLLLTPFVIAYLCLIHLVPPESRSWFSKELAVAVLFTAGSFLPVWARLRSIRDVPFLSLALFVIVCWMSCIVIEYSEWIGLRQARLKSPHRWTVALGRHLDAVALPVAAAALCAVFLRPWSGNWPVLTAEALTALALGVLGSCWRDLSLDLNRVLADFVLLTPGLVLPFLYR
jgi:hypothetical protein